jgi:hypothetical protein
MDIFANNSGSVAINSAGTKSFVRFADGDRYDIIMAEIDAAVADDYQIKRSFRGDQYITAFGQSLVPITFSGVYIPTACAADSGPATPKLKRFYAQNRVSKYKTISITIGDFNYKGVLVRMDLKPVIIKNVRGLNYKITIIGQAEL